MIIYSTPTTHIYSNKLVNKSHNDKLTDNFMLKDSYKPCFKSLEKENFNKLNPRQKFFLLLQKPIAMLKDGVNFASNYNLSALEGIQDGIDIFKGLSLKQIAFIGDELSTIATKQGCYSKCVHCYADARKPFKETDAETSTILFDDFKSLIDGFCELKNRTGLDFVNLKYKSPYLSLIFDSDDMDVSIKDKNGVVHEFPELNKMLLDKFGYKCIFDTSGWNIKSLGQQKRAERLVEYYSKDNNMNELYQFNLSINPFHSIYQKSVELKKNGYFDKSQKLYDVYIDRQANALFTFIPLLNKPNFGILARAMSCDDNTVNEHALSKILSDIQDRFKEKCLNDLNGVQKYIKTKDDLDVVLGNLSLDKVIIDTDIFYGKKVDDFVKANKIFYPTTLDRYSLTNDLYEKQLSSKSLNYFYSIILNKIIDVTGKVYVSDNYRIIPTDMQLNFSNKNKHCDTFHPLVEDFRITQNML